MDRQCCYLCSYCTNCVGFCNSIRGGQNQEKIRQSGPEKFIVNGIGRIQDREAWRNERRLCLRRVGGGFIFPCSIQKILKNLRYTPNLPKNLFRTGERSELCEILSAENCRIVRVPPDRCMLESIAYRQNLPVKFGG